MNQARQRYARAERTKPNATHYAALPACPARGSCPVLANLLARPQADQQRIEPERLPPMRGQAQPNYQFYSEHLKARLLQPSRGGIWLIGQPGRVRRKPR